MYISPPNFIRRIFPSLIWTMPETDRVYLTFDDGPTPGVTEWIVDQLARYDAKATFFCLGKNAEQHPHLFRMLVDGGHRIGNHTYSHQKGWRMSLERYLEDVDFANGLLQTDLFRPPYGRIKPVAGAPAERAVSYRNVGCAEPRLQSSDFAPHLPAQCDEACQGRVDRRVSRLGQVVPQFAVRAARTLDFLYERGSSAP